MKLCLRKAVVLGAGVMGASIAAHLAGNGMEVVLLDIPAAEGPRSKPAQAAKKRLLDPRTRALYARSAGDLIRTGNFEDDLHLAADADWVIEAIVEKLEPKKDLFGKLSAVVKEGCILSSNTSGISMAAIAQSVREDQRPYFIGTHFFNPPRYMELLELIPIPETAPEVITAISEFAEKRLGKSIVVAKDTPNFIANRIGVASTAFFLHAMDRFDVSVADADYLTGKLLKRPAGTAKTVDLVGFDIVKATTATNHSAEEDPTFKEMMTLPPFFTTMMDKGLMGNKVKQGFYKKEGQTRLMWDQRQETYVPVAATLVPEMDNQTPLASQVTKLVESGTPEGDFLWYYLKELLIYTAQRIPEITDDFRKVDRAMHLGYNWGLGPFELWDALGAESLTAKLITDGAELPNWVQDHLNNNGGRFYKSDDALFEEKYLAIKDNDENLIWRSEDVLLKDLGDGVGAIVLATPHAAISNRAAAGIIEAVGKAEKHFKAAVLTSCGKHFCVGAELKDVLDAVDNEAWDALADNISRFQAMTEAVKYARIPIVAAPFGSTLGGGAELCLHAHKVVAHSELNIGLVEPQVGLVPAGGGLKEMTLRVMEPACYTPELYTLPLLKKYVMLVANCQVSSSALNAVEMGLLRSTDRIVPKGEMLLAAAKDEALSLVNTFIPQVRKQVTVFGTTGYAALAAQLRDMSQGNFISEYDGVIALAIAGVMTGGGVPEGTTVSEARLLELERQAFVKLCKEKNTRERIEGLLKTGKALRN